MDIKIDINPIGFIRSKEGTFSIELAEKYIPALTNISGFSHSQIIWWGHLYANTKHGEIYNYLELRDDLIKKGLLKLVFLQHAHRYAQILFS